MKERFKAELQELDSGLRLDRPREAQEEAQEKLKERGQNL